MKAPAATATAIAIAIALVVVTAASVRADTFEGVASKANSVSRLDDIIWAFVGACDKGDDIQQRQCRLIRDKRAKDLVGQFLLVDGESAALEITKWSPQKKSLGITVTSCIRCAGLEVEGKKYQVIGAGQPPRWEGQKLRTQVLHDTTQMFKDEASATAWTKSLENAHVQYVVKVPASPKWTANGNNGLSLEVVAWRVIAPCDGTIVAANPPSQAQTPDPKACGGAPVVVDPSNTGNQKPEKLPEALTGAMIKLAMQPVTDAANACFQRYKVSGRAKLVMQIAGDGSVLEYEQQGDFVGTQTATCIDTAMKKITFPKTQKPKTKVGFPIVLQ